jgi:antibiotic biosynthesis monooxygenase (ABM) superfamily enzyme
LIVTSPTFLVVSLWIREGRVADFEAYERKMSRIMTRYGGVVERTVRISEPGTVSDQPFEVHVVCFPSQAMCEAYRPDAEGKALSIEREAVIMKTVLLKGTLGPAYAT